MKKIRDSIVHWWFHHFLWHETPEFKDGSYQQSEPKGKNPGKDWQGQNIPHVHARDDGSTVSVLPVLEFLLEYDQDTLKDLLPDLEAYVRDGWGMDAP